MLSKLKYARFKPHKILKHTNSNKRYLNTLQRVFRNQIMLSQISYRCFATSQGKILYSTEGMLTRKTKDERFESMRNREEIYERYLQNKDFDPVGFQEHGYKYFRELNRKRDYLAVKRLYEKYHDDPELPETK